MLCSERMGRRGFTLLELGIVVAVAVVLASVVIVGKGFIRGGRTAKAMDAVDIIRKGAATLAVKTGGRFAAISSNSELPQLSGRFIPDLGGNPFWEPVPGVQIDNVQWTPGFGNNNILGIRLNCTQLGMCADLWHAYDRDSSRVDSGGAAGVGLRCSIPALINDSVTRVVLCFRV